jgi:ribosomal protein S18 acetylase RimI-like enzyme
LELALQMTPIASTHLPAGITWQGWSPELAATHAVLLYEGFRGEDDATLLRSLSTLEGCSNLMDRTVECEGFLPDAAWLALSSRVSGPSVPCAAIQVVRLSQSTVRVMNLAVLPEFRGRGIGRAILCRALRNCRSLGFQRAQLDVTASNAVALGLYASLGFKRRNVFYEPTDDARQS